MSYLFAAMVLLPLLLGLYIMATDKRPRAARKTAINGSGIVLAISLLFYYLYDTTQGGYQFLYSLSWMEGLGVQIRVGLDGLGLTMVLLTTILTFITLIFVDVNSYDATRYVVFILILQTMLTGVFVALDFILFYLFWELVLIPMYFMILEWGGANRRYAAIKFFLYTHVGSFIMLAGIIAMYFHHGSAEGFYTMNILEYLRYDFPREFQLLVFPMLFLGFAFKLPLVPFHTWLPDAHVEAPTAGSMLLAGVMLKMGGYGLIRFGFAICP